MKYTTLGLLVAGLCVLCASALLAQDAVPPRAGAAPAATRADSETPIPVPPANEAEARERIARLEREIADLRREQEERDSEMEQRLSDIEDSGSPRAVRRLGSGKDFALFMGGFTQFGYAAIQKEGGLGGDGYTRASFTDSYLTLHINGEYKSRFSMQTTTFIGKTRGLSIAGIINGETDFANFDGFVVPDPAGPGPQNNYSGTRRLDASINGSEFFALLYVLTSTYEFSPYARVRLGQMPARFADVDLLVYSNLRRAMDAPQYVRALGRPLGGGLSHRMVVENLQGAMVDGLLTDSEFCSLSYAVYGGRSSFTGGLGIDEYVFGERLIANVPDWNLSGGLSHQHFRQAQQRDTMGIDIIYSAGDVEIRNEAVLGLFKDRSARDFSIYTEPAYRVMSNEAAGDLWLYARVDWFHSHRRGAAGLIGEGTDYKLGVNFQPVLGASVQLRLEYTYKDYNMNRVLPVFVALDPDTPAQRRDFHLLGFLLTVSF